MFFPFGPRGVPTRQASIGKENDLTNLLSSCCISFLFIVPLCFLQKKITKRMSEITSVLAAVDFAVIHHGTETRKHEAKLPYVSHPISVALLASLYTDDIKVIQACIFHDLLENTKVEPALISDIYGEDVLKLVQEVTDDKSLPRDQRKAAQIEKASKLSSQAKFIKLCDKIDNLRGLLYTEKSGIPVGWTVEDITKYVNHAKAVYEGGLKDNNKDLDKIFESLLDFHSSKKG
jgi:guanosine-3',5'-bis(diphosphate) 3'-pyrophosphohydrolase